MICFRLVCPCGLTVVLPPVPCNFKIECSHPCRQPMACGHPQIPHLCHSLENHPCPPCPYLVKKPCACGKTEVANVRCAMESSRVSCGKPCGALLRCGFHRCRKPCHPPGECEPRCVQQCSKPRRHCSHPCAELCHAPRSCPTHTPCPTPIELVCECGRERQRVKCGSSDEQPEGARARAPLACTDACARAKRNEALASALGIENHEPSVRAVEYDPVMLAWYSDNKVRLSPVCLRALRLTQLHYSHGAMLSRARSPSLCAAASPTCTCPSCAVLNVNS